MMPISLLTFFCLFMLTESLFAQQLQGETNGKTLSVQLASTTHITSQHLQDGTATIKVSNAQLPFTYTINNQPSSAPLTDNELVLTQLAPGTYSVLIKDASGASKRVSIFIKQPRLVANVNAKQLEAQVEQTYSKNVREEIYPYLHTERSDITFIQAPDLVVPVLASQSLYIPNQAIKKFAAEEVGIIHETGISTAATNQAVSEVLSIAVDRSAKNLKLLISTTTDETVKISLIDRLGRRVQTLTTDPDVPVHVADNLRPGNYFAVCTQGSKISVIKVVKQEH